METEHPALFTACIEHTDLQCDAWSSQPLLLSLERGSIDWPSWCYAAGTAEPATVTSIQARIVAPGASQRTPCTGR